MSILEAGLVVLAMAGTAQSDELAIEYPDDGGQVLAVLTYYNSEKMNSRGGVQVVESRYGPITVRIVISQGPETLVVLDWPLDLWPMPPEIVVEDGDEGQIEFVLPMM